MVTTLLRYIYIISLLSLLVVWGCKEAEKPLDGSQLAGRWELVSASVNGSDTDRLRDLYFVFLPDTSMQTNILGSEANFKYALVDRLLEQKSDPALNYQLQELNDTIIMMSTEIRGSTFEITLGKAKSKR